jgi:DNA polymerase-3 subunit gamma/tau
MNDATTPDDSGTPGLGLGLPQRGSNYRVLARKYRPASFADLIGQEAMVRTISNAFETGRIPQAWILTGVRGVGKTTTARILARALNYELPDGSITGPSIQMPTLGLNCQAIMESRHVDVLEMDAASHNWTRCTCSRPRPSMRCSRRWRSRRRTPNSSSRPRKSARFR